MTAPAQMTGRELWDLWMTIGSTFFRRNNITLPDGRRWLYFDFNSRAPKRAIACLYVHGCVGMHDVENTMFHVTGRID